MSLLAQRSDLKQSIHSIAGPASYATGGFAFNPNNESGNPNTVGTAFIDPQNTTYEARFDYANKKIIAIVRATGAEVTATTDLSGVTFKVLVSYL